MCDRAIADPKLEGVVRELMVAALLASGSLYAFDEGDRNLLNALENLALEIRDLLRESQYE